MMSEMTICNVDPRPADGKSEDTGQKMNKYVKLSGLKWKDTIQQGEIAINYYKYRVRMSTKDNIRWIRTQFTLMIRNV